MTYQIVLNTCSGAEEAERIAHSLVETGLAACVNVVPAITSIYRWQGRVERAQEALLVIKALATRYHAIEAHIKKSHSYDVPEVVALPIEQGSRDYLKWLETCQDTR